MKNRFQTAIASIVRAGIYLGIMLAFRPKFIYEDKSVQDRQLAGAAIVVSNHRSCYDPPMLCSVFCRNTLHMLAAEVLYLSKPLAWLLDCCQCIKIDRQAIDIDSFRRITDILQSGGAVGMFPEGQLNTAEELLPFKAGMMLAAAVTGTQVIPVYIRDKYKVFMHRQRIVIGVPYRMDAPAAITAEYLERAAAEVRGRLIQLAEMAKGL